MEMEENNIIRVFFLSFSNRKEATYRKTNTECSKPVRHGPHRNCIDFWCYKWNWRQAHVGAHNWIATFCCVAHRTPRRRNGRDKITQQPTGCSYDQKSDTRFNYAVSPSNNIVNRNHGNPLKNKRMLEVLIGRKILKSTKKILFARMWDWRMKLMKKGHFLYCLSLTNRSFW